MGLFCIKRSMITQIRNIKIKREIDTAPEIGILMFILFLLTVILQSLKLLINKNQVIYQRFYLIW